MINKIFISALVLALSPLQSIARDYHVEAIIFTNTVSAEPEIVSWDDKAPRNIRAQNKLDTLYRQAVEATEAREEAALIEAEENLTTTTDPIEPVEDSALKDEPIKTEISFELIELLGIQDKLEQSPDHKVLETLSWNQSEADYRTSPLINTLTPHMKGVIRVYAPNLLFAEVNLTYVPGEIFEASLDQDLDNSTDEPEPVLTSGFDTTYATTTYGSEFAIQTLPEPVFAHYFIDEQRKLKLNEIHYFDHPRFGVILSVKPIEEPEPKISS